MNVSGAATKVKPRKPWAKVIVTAAVAGIAGVVGMISKAQERAEEKATKKTDDATKKAPEQAASTATASTAPASAVGDLSEERAKIAKDRAELEAEKAKIARTKAEQETADALAMLLSEREKREAAEREVGELRAKNAAPKKRVIPEVVETTGTAVESKT